MPCYTYSIMNFSPEKGGYFNKKGEEIDFSEKRLQFWLENIPPDVRRLQHDLLIVSSFSD